MQIETSPIGAQPPAPRTPRAAGGSDYQTFLTMLTVQMQYQDPLKPMASTDFAEQLATFSAVEQQTQTNSLLTALVNRAGLADMGGWIGLQARVEGQGWFGGQPLDLAPAPAPGSDRAVLVVTDALGVAVDRREVPLTGGTYRWPGTGPDGLPLPTGRYGFSLESWSGSERLAADSVAVYQTIHEVRAGAEGPLLVLPGDLVLDSTRISGLRQPPA